jgi:hypothetical protein
MERPRVADLHRITTFLTNLYDFADIGRFRRRLLTTLPALVPAVSWAVFERANRRHVERHTSHLHGLRCPSGREAGSPSGTPTDTEEGAGGSRGWSTPGSETHREWCRGVEGSSGERL